jgi:spore coat protein U-like protein
VLLGLLVALGAQAPAHAATASSQAQVIIVQPLTLVKVNDLDFGDIAPGPVSGTVDINPATGVRTTTNVIPLGGSPREAVFAGAARFGFALTVAISPSPVLNRVGGGASMTTQLQVDGGTGVRFFPGIGPQIFRVGGRLNVGANQAVGSYTGQFTLTVNYF